MNKQLSSLLQKEVTRSEFLATMGLGIASVLGFGSLVRLLTDRQTPGAHTLSSQYGSGAYGGRR